MRAHTPPAYAGVVGAILALALVCSAGALAGSRTTQPGKNALVYFVIDEHKVIVQIFRDTPNESGGHDLFPEKYLVRGDFATFILVNRGKKPHGFSFLGKKVAPVRPGHRMRIGRRALLVRGALPYRSTTDKGKAFKGVFPVY